MIARVQEFTMPHGVVQIVEVSDGECQVGYCPTETGRWQHWGKGAGGYDATVERFKMSSTFNPEAPAPKYR